MSGAQVATETANAAVFVNGTTGLGLTGATKSR